MNKETAVISNLSIRSPIFLYLKNEVKVLGVLFVQYDQLTLICEQSEPTFKYRQLLPPVVQALVQPSEPLQRKGRRFGDWS